MPRFGEGMSDKAGLSPGTLMHVGEESSAGTEIELILYDQQNLDIQHLSSTHSLAGYLEGKANAWIDVKGIHDPAVVQNIGQEFQIHSLILEDILNTEHRPKLDQLEEYLFVSLKALGYHRQPNGPGLQVEHLSLVMTQDCLLSFQKADQDMFQSVKSRLAKIKSRHRRKGQDYLLYSLLDTAVDSYFVVLEHMGDCLEELEQELVEDPGPETAQRIHALKKDLIYFRKFVWPVREIVGKLRKQENDLMGDGVRMYLEDLLDHVIHVLDAIEVYREMVSGMQDSYLSRVSYKMNEIMKVLTVIATIFIPLTFVVGIYGMNFQYMPELAWKWGYPAVLLIMLGLVAAMLVWFRKKKFL
jgi:magnesium transporter